MFKEKGDPKASAAGKKGGAISSRKGIPNKRSEEVRQKMEALKVDPATFLAMAMKNDLAMPEHPLVTSVLKVDSEKLPTADQWKKIVGFALQARDSFRCFVPLDQRQKAAAELLPYLYPRLKQIEISDSDGNSFAEMLRGALINK